MKLFSKKIQLPCYVYAFSLLCLFGYNFTLIRQIFAAEKSPIECLAMIACIYLFFNMAFLLLFWKKITRILSIFFILANAALSYFMIIYNTAIDQVMLLNVLRTDIYEVQALLNFKLFLHIIGLGILPAVVVYKLKFENCPIASRAKHLAINLVLLLLIVLPNLKAADNIWREQKHLRYYLLPTNYIGSVISMLRDADFSTHETVTIGDDISIEKYWNNDKKNLIVFVVGETARAANFSLGGYNRPTNDALLPYQQNFAYFSNFFACGTSTAVSVPCMFSAYPQKGFKPASAAYTENLTDIMQKAGYKSLWRENNTGCQKVCRRIEVEKLCKKKHCNDEILLTNFEERIYDAGKDMFLILHQRGSHGPDYYNMYPKSFEKYKPVCKTNILPKCKKQKLINAFDNTIEYTSYFLAQTISKLEAMSDEYNILMIYSSDHGESLGENKVYLHSAIYKNAPIEQIHIPFFIWMPKSTQNEFGYDMNCLQKIAKKRFSHDNIFHTILGFSGAKTNAYNAGSDILAKCKKSLAK